MKSVRIALLSEWILKHRADTVMPISNARQFLVEKYKSKIKILHEDFQSMDFEIDDSADVPKIKDLLCSFLAKTYEDFNSATLNVYEIKDAAEFESLGNAAAESHPEPEKDQSANQEDFQQFLGKLFESDAGKSAADSSAKSAKPDSNTTATKAQPNEVLNVLAKIDALISGAEFKKLAHEVATLAPVVQKNNSLSVFFSQHYLFSVNDGCGLENYLSLFAELLTAASLRKLKSNVSMLKLNTQKPNTEDVFYLMLRDLASMSKSDVVCIDISDWMNQLTSPEFRAFLQKVNEMDRAGLLVFRIPFVDKEVLSQTARALNDIMFIKELSLPPYTNEEIGAIAAKELSNYKFSMDEKAWSGFFQRIREESSDGRFYGMNTIKKVVNELLYNKQLENAKNNVDDFIINAHDTDNLCSASYIDDKSGMEMLESMVGTDGIKTRVLEILSQIDLARKTPSMEIPCLHMRFVGNPGTGKTTVARIIGKILKEKGILRIGEFHEHSGRDFCGRYIGETAPKTMSICRAAYGSVLFVDEAYSLYRGEDNDRDFGREALDTLIAEMENHRNDFVVIMAGYTDEMDKLMKGNVGLLSRMPYTVEFPNFTKEQLYQIFVAMCNGKIEYDNDLMSAVEEYFNGLDDNFIKSKEFSNARFVRNLYERVCAKAAMRCQLDGQENIVLTKDDFTRSIGDSEFALNKKKSNKIGFGQ